MRIDLVAGADVVAESAATVRAARSRSLAFRYAVGFACLVPALAPVRAATVATPAVAAVAATAKLTAPSAQAAPSPQVAPAAGGTAERTPPSPTAQALTHLEEETLVLKARLKALETEAQIAQRSAELTRLTAAGERNGFVVRAVEGIGGAMYATLWSRDDGELEVKQGDTLPNGMHIVSIRASEVLARPAHGGKNVALPMATNRQPGLPYGQNVADTPTAGGPATGIPGIPPLPRY